MCNYTRSMLCPPLADSLVVAFQLPWVYHFG